MPTYQYRCTECGQPFERYQSFTDDAIEVCPLPVDRPKGFDGSDAPKGEPACGGAVKKVFGNVGIAFKGSGFYRNDSRSGASAAKKESRSGTTAGDASSSDAGSSDKGSTKSDKASKGDAGSATKSTDNGSASGNKSDKKAKASSSS